MEPVEYALMDAVEDGMWWYRALHARAIDALNDHLATARPETGLPADDGVGDRPGRDHAHPSTVSTAVSDPLSPFGPVDAPEANGHWQGSSGQHAFDPPPGLSHAASSASALPPRVTVLDAGCGTGGFLRRLGLALPGLTKVGLEYNPGAAFRAALKSGGAITSGSINTLPFADRSFGAVVSLDVLSHRAVEPGMALSELHRVLAPGGTLALNLPAYEWLKSVHDVRVHNDRRFTAGGTKTLLREAGFEVVSVHYWNGLLFPLMALQRKLLARGEMAASDVQAFSPWLDRLLYRVTTFERGLSRAGLHLPFGGSILAIARRPADAAPRLPQPPSEEPRP